MTQPLPERPDFGQLKKQAKDLLNAVHDGETSALQRAAIGSANHEPFALHDAQRIIAREYGFPSWAKLKLHLETWTAVAAEARLIDGVLDGDDHTVDTLLRERPGLAKTSLAVASALGDDALVAAELARNAAWATAQVGARQWPPLLYVCFGRRGGSDESRARAARHLLELGADPNSHWVHCDWPEAPLSALYGATGVNDYPKLARVLLQAGADPNDGESRYHAAEHNHLASLEVLASFGTDFSGTDQRWGNTPLCFLLGSVHPAASVRAGVSWLLDHGADPNVRSYVTGINEAPLHAAVRNGWDIETIERLLNQGADPNARRADGRTPYALAVVLGRQEAIALLKERGAATDVASVDALLGACLRADRSAVAEALRGHPGIVQAIPAHDFKIVEIAAREDRADALAVMSDIGIDVTRPISEGATALHWAAWHGRANAVRLLLSRGADSEARDHRFNATPMGWCAHGSQNAGAHTADYSGVAEALLTAGAAIPPDTIASDEVMAVLRNHGFTPNSKREA